MLYLGILGLEFKDNIVIFEISVLEFALLGKICKIIKMAKFRTKNALLGYFGARIFKKLLSYLKSASSNL